MRLFGKINGVIDRQDRATFGFLTPFDAPLPAPAEPAASPEWANYLTVTAGGLVTAVAYKPRQTWKTNRRSQIGRDR